jgi:hypothetical protein
VVYDCVGGGEERTFVAIAPPDKVRRAAVLTMHLDDHSSAVFVTHVMSLDDQLIAYICSHRSSQ